MKTCGPHRMEWAKCESITLKIRSFKTRKKTDVCTLSLIISVVLEPIVTAINHEKEIKGVETREEEVKHLLPTDDMIPKDIPKGDLMIPPKNF